MLNSRTAAAFFALTIYVLVKTRQQDCRKGQEHGPITDLMMIETNPYM